MAKENKKVEPRVIYKKDPKLTETGFTEFKDAKEVHDSLLKQYPEPGHRVRTLLRSRTRSWDVVVKVRTEVTP